MSADWNRPGYIHVPAPCRQVRKCCSLMESALRERQGKFYDVVLCHIIISCITMILFTYIHVLVSSWSAWFSKPHTMEAYHPVWYDCSRLLGNRIPKYLERCSQPLGRAVPTTVCQRMPCFSELHIYFNAFRRYLNIMIKRTENRDRRQKGRLIISTKLGIAEYRIIP